MLAGVEHVAGYGEPLGRRLNAVLFQALDVSIHVFRLSLILDSVKPFRHKAASPSGVAVTSAPVADTGIVIIGAGIVGLAIADRLSRDGLGCVVLERGERYGTETSSRNSEVVHAGIYYAPGSLKARLCVAGNRLIYELGEKGAVPCRRTGKIITATNADELSRLDELLERGRANGAELQILSAAQVSSLEPSIASVGGVLSPNSGIVSAHGMMDYFARQAQGNGAVVQARTEVIDIDRGSGDYRVTVRSAGETESITCERLVNAAGLAADEVAALCGIDVEAAGYRQHYAKGSYFAVQGAAAPRLTRLVYPVPNPQSLGVHAVIGLDGRLKFGPDVEFLEGRERDYRVDENKRAAFGTAIRRLLPSLRDADLTPDMSGIRPKLQAPGTPPRDFVIEEESARGLPGLVTLVGIDSPGLTAAPAIADHVAELLA